MKITDEMLFAHAAEARDIYLSTLPSDEELPDVSFSKSFHRKMNKLLREQRRSPRVNQILRYLKRTVAAVLAIAVLTFGGLMTVEAYRTQIIEVIVQVFERFTKYQFISHDDHTEEISLPEMSVEYIPDGMKEVKSQLIDDSLYYVIYENDRGQSFEITLCAIQPNSTYGMLIDTEDSTYAIIDINGQEAYSNTKNGISNIIWTYGHIVYSVSGNIRLDELEFIAEKLKIFEK